MKEAKRKRNLLKNVALKASEKSWGHLSIGTKCSEKEEVSGRSQAGPEWLWRIFTVQTVSSSKFTIQITFSEPWMTDYNHFNSKSPKLLQFASSLSCIQLLSRCCASSHVAWRGTWQGTWLAPLEHTRFFWILLIEKWATACRMWGEKGCLCWTVLQGRRRESRDKTEG